MQQQSLCMVVEEAVQRHGQARESGGREVIKAWVGEHHFEQIFLDSKEDLMSESSFSQGYPHE